MTTAKETRYGRASRYARMSCAGLFLLCQLGCSSRSDAPPTSLHFVAPCAPAEVKERLRLYLSSLGIESNESTKDNQTFLVATDFILEPRDGRLDKQVRYKLEVKPGATAATSSIDLDFDVETKGIREGTWEDKEGRGAEAQYKQPILKQLPGICTFGQQ